ncbi:hypothetical protein LP414_29500 [Polaromonas sp. P1(28)-13]|nr:hypothetical protein LP414_29500 [Polaromonas sp. P1(28)-13]
MQTRLRLKQARALIRLDFRSSAHTEGVRRNTNSQTAELHKYAPWRVLILVLVFGIRFLACPVLAGPALLKESGIRAALFEPQASLRGPPLSLSSTGCPERSAGTQTAGRLFFGYFLLAKQKKVTSRRATPGLRPQKIPTTRNREANK